MREDVLQALLLDFNEGETFFDHLAGDVVVEFPYGPLLDIPARIIGKDAVRSHFETAWESGWRVGDITIEAMHRERYSVEYTGRYRDNQAMDLPVVAIVETRAGQVCRIREYWDTLRMAELRREVQTA